MRILLFRTDRLGETLLTVPLMHALKHAQKDNTLTVVCHPVMAAFLEAVPWIDKVIAAPDGRNPAWWRQAWDVRRKLRAQDFDCTVIAHPYKAWHFLAWVKRIPRRIGYLRKWGFLLTDTVPDRRQDLGTHEVRFNLQLLRPLGIISESPEWGLPLTTAAERNAFRSRFGIPADDTIVAVHPWASTPQKQWPIERFKQTAARLQQPGQTVVLIGGPEEKVHARSSEMEAWPAIDLTGRLNLNELALCLQEAQLLVSNDSGPVHMASAYQRPVVALFGTDTPGTLPDRWGPWGENTAVVQGPSMQAIPVDSVIDACNRLLRRPSACR